MIPFRNIFFVAHPVCYIWSDQTALVVLVAKEFSAKYRNLSDRVEKYDSRTSKEQLHISDTSQTSQTQRVVDHSVENSNRKKKCIKILQIFNFLPLPSSPACPR